MSSQQVHPALPQDDLPSVQKKRRSHVGRVCLNCRRRKSKCDGTPPTCRTCQTYNDDCCWAADEDGRKPASRQYVQALKTRIRTLEGLLSTQDVPLPSFEGVIEDTDAEEEMYSVDQITQNVLQFNMSEDGEEIQFHAPTSAYAHTITHQTKDLSQEAKENDPFDTSLHDFRRVLPAAVPISTAQHTLVLERFFTFFASWGLRAVRDLFYRDMQRYVTSPTGFKLPRTTHYSPLLHNEVLAIALTFADEEYLRAPSVREVFASEAQKYLNAELERPTIATVHALALKSSYHSTNDEHTAGWTYMGMAERAAQSLGLNVDCTPFVESGRMSSAEMLLRRNTFWTVFIQDQCWSVYIGRSSQVQEYTTPLPIVNTRLDQAIWQRNPGHPSSEQNSEEPCNLSTAFVELAKLSLIMRRVMTTLYSLRSDAMKLQRDNTISELSLALDTWNEQLPPTMVLSGHSMKNARPQVLNLQLAREWLVILIYRPYYRPMVGISHTKMTDVPETISTIAVGRCDRSAMRINSLLRSYHDLYDLRYSPPTLLTVAFTAGTTHLLSAVHHKSSRITAASLEAAHECVDLLRLVAVSWPAAGRKASILENLVQEYNVPFVGGVKVHRPNRGSSQMGGSTRHLDIASKATDGENTPTQKSARSSSLTPALLLPIRSADSWRSVDDINTSSRTSGDAAEWALPDWLASSPHQHVAPVFHREDDSQLDIFGNFELPSTPIASHRSDQFEAQGADPFLNALFTQISMPSQSDTSEAMLWPNSGYSSQLYPSQLFGSLDSTSHDLESSYLANYTAPPHPTTDHTHRTDLQDQVEETNMMWASMFGGTR